MKAYGMTKTANYMIEDRRKNPRSFTMKKFTRQARKHARQLALKDINYNIRTMLDEIAYIKQPLNEMFECYETQCPYEAAFYEEFKDIDYTDMMPHEYTEPYIYDFDEYDFGDY